MIQGQHWKSQILGVGQVIEMQTVTPKFIAPTINCLIKTCPWKSIKIPRKQWPSSTFAQCVSGYIRDIPYHGHLIPIYPNSSSHSFQQATRSSAVVSQAWNTSRIPENLENLGISSAIREFTGFFRMFCSTHRESVEFKQQMGTAKSSQKTSWNTVSHMEY